MTDHQFTQKVYDGDAYKEYDDTLGGSPYVGGSVDNLLQNKAPFEAFVVGLIVFGIIALVIYILMESTLDSWIVWSAGVLIVGYLLWENFSDTVRKFLF
jgi:hypothetical protein